MLLSFQRKMQPRLRVCLWHGLPRALELLMLLRQGVLMRNFGSPICLPLIHFAKPRGLRSIQPTPDCPGEPIRNFSHTAKSFPLQNISESSSPVRSRRKYAKTGVREHYRKPKTIYVPCSVWSSQDHLVSKVSLSERELKGKAEPLLPTPPTIAGLPRGCSKAWDSSPRSL